MSLYLGAAALGLAVVAAAAPGPYRRRLALLGLAAAVICLGRWAGGEWVLPALPIVSRFRIPAKAFFTVHLAIALLVAFALDDLQGGRLRWRYAGALLVAAMLLFVPALALLSPSIKRWLLLGFLPPDTTWPDRLAQSQFILRDGAIGAMVAFIGAFLCVLSHRGRLAPPALAGALCALLATDLLRTGAGLSPTVTGSFFQLSPQMEGEAERLRAEDRRVFT